MKRILIWNIVAVAVTICSGYSRAGEGGEEIDPAGPAVKEVDPLVVKHDINGNGKIDVNERKAFVRERALRRRQEARQIASQRPSLSRYERLFLKPIRWDRATREKYDANKNGRLEVQERIKAMNDAADAAREEFRKHDRNGDGKLDGVEFSAIGGKGSVSLRSRSGRSARK